MREFKIRASSTSKIMTEPRSKSEWLSKTCTTYLEEWVKEQIYDRKKEFTSKYTEKGNEVETLAIDFAADVFGWGMVFKNEDIYSNKFMKGTPDLILADRIIDIKCSWDCFTFPLFETAPDNGYWWQLQTYMALTGKEQATLIYCLVDTPDELIEREIKSIMYKECIFDETEDFVDRISSRMKYNDIPSEYRIKTFDIARDNGAIGAIINRVRECRQYIESITDKITLQK